MLFTKITTAASLLALAIANPIPEASPVAEAEPIPSPDAETISSIVKRAEGIHLVNCNRNGVDVYSAVVVRIPLYYICRIYNLTTESSVPTTATATSSLDLETNVSQETVELRTGRALLRAALSQALV